MLDLEDLINYSEQYEHVLVGRLTDSNGYDVKGKINFKHNLIMYNLNYATPNQLAETLCHEIYHHYFIKELGHDMPEHIVEDMGMLLYQDNKNEIENYVLNKIGVRK